MVFSASATRKKNGGQIDVRVDIDRKTGDYNEFWKGRDYLHVTGNVKAAVLMAHAFNDWNVMPEHSVRIYQAAKARGLPVQCYFHQAGHGGPPPIKLMNRWLTFYSFPLIRPGVRRAHFASAWIMRCGFTNRPT